MGILDVRVTHEQYAGRAQKSLLVESDVAIVSDPTIVTPHPDPPPQGGREFREWARGRETIATPHSDPPPPGGREFWESARGREGSSDAGYIALKVSYTVTWPPLVSTGQPLASSAAASMEPASTML
jgi:hypothetical protein